MLGLAVGDALGTTLEFQPPGTFKPLTDMVGGGPFNLNAGEWTDDTSMALCLAESLLERGFFDARDQMQRYLAWYRKGYLSSNGRCFDIGTTVRAALESFERTGDPLSGDTRPTTAGNGSLMRLAPVPLFFVGNPELAIKMSGESSKTTHGALTSVDACRYFAGLLLGALNGRTKEELLAPMFCPVDGLWENIPLCQEIDDIARGAFEVKMPPEIAGTGYVVRSLEAVLWAFYKTNDFATGCLLAANLGDDADTTAAIYGQLAGAYYGVQAIPSSWLAKLVKRQLISSMAEMLYKCAAK